MSQANNKNEILNNIDKKEMELSQLKHEYNELVSIEKRAILSSKKLEPMAKSKYLHGFEFESSSSRTEQYLEFHKVFKKEFTELMKPIVSEIEFSKPNHFDVSGFFKTQKGNVFYFSLSDLRWSKNHLMYRTAKDFKDYTGGANQEIAFDNIEKLPELIEKYEGRIK